MGNRTERLELSDSGIGPADLKAWGELKGRIAWDVLWFAETSCRTKADRLELLASTVDEIIARVRREGAA